MKRLFTMLLACLLTLSLGVILAGPATPQPIPSPKPTKQTGNKPAPKPTPTPSPTSDSNSLWLVDFAQDNTPDVVSVDSRYCWDIGDHMVLYARDSQLSFKFKLPDEGDFSSYKMVLTCRGDFLQVNMSDYMMQTGIFSPFTINVNNEPLVENYDVQWINDQPVYFQVGSLLASGDNTITITIDQVSQTRFEVARVELLKK